MRDNPYQPTMTETALHSRRVSVSSWVATAGAVAVWGMLIVLIGLNGNPTLVGGTLHLEFDGTLPFTAKKDPFTFSVMFIETSVLVAIVHAFILLVITLAVSQLMAYCWRRIRFR